MGTVLDKKMSVAIYTKLPSRPINFFILYQVTGVTMPILKPKMPVEFQEVTAVSPLYRANNIQSRTVLFPSRRMRLVVLGFVGLGVKQRGSISVRLLGS